MSVLTTTATRQKGLQARFMFVGLIDEGGLLIYDAAESWQSDSRRKQDSFIVKSWPIAGHLSSSGNAMYS